MKLLTWSSSDISLSTRFECVRIGGLRCGTLRLDALFGSKSDAHLNDKMFDSFWWYVLWCERPESSGKKLSHRAYILALFGYKLMVEGPSNGWP